MFFKSVVRLKNKWSKEGEKKNKIDNKKSINFGSLQFEIENKRSTAMLFNAWMELREHILNVTLKITNNGIGVLNSVICTCTGVHNVCVRVCARAQALARTVP